VIFVIKSIIILFSAYQQPYVVGVNFDGSEVGAGDGDAANTDESFLPSGYIGFHLLFTQDAPTQP
jgi:hypothetical protein